MVIPETARSPSTVTARLGNPGCRRRRPQCHCPRYRNVLLIGSPPRHPHRAPSRNQCHVPLRGNDSSRAESFGQLDSNETRATLASRQDDRGFRGPRSVCFLQTLQLVPPTMGIVPASPNDNEKGSSDCRSPRHTGRTHPARCPTHHRTVHQVAVFRPLRRRRPAVPKVPAEHTRSLCKWVVNSAFIRPPSLERRHEIQLSVEKRNHLRSGRPRRPLLGKCCADLAESCFWAPGPRCNKSSSTCHTQNQIECQTQRPRREAARGATPNPRVKKLHE